MSVTYKISGRGEKGGPVKKMLIFSANIFVDGKVVGDAKKEDLQVFIECPDPAIKVNVMGGTKGVYHIGFTPNVEGQYWADFLFKGTWADKPYLLPIDDGKAGKHVPSNPYTGSLKKENGGGGGGGGSGGAPKADGEKKRAEEERKRKEEEERKRQEEEEERLRLDEERKKQEEEEERLKQEEEEERLRLEEEEERLRQEEAERVRQEEEKRKEEEEKEKKKKEEEKKKKDEEERKKKEEEERKKKDTVTRTAKQKADEEAARKKAAADEAARKKADEEAARKKADEDATKKKADEAAKKKEEGARKKEEVDVVADEGGQEENAYKTASGIIIPQNPLGAYAGHVDGMMFMFRALNKHGQPKKTGGSLSLFTVYANEEQVETVEDAGDGLYCFDYQSVPGLNRIDVQFNGKSIKGFPIEFTRKTEDEIMEEAMLAAEEEERIKAEEEEKRRKEEEERKKQEEEERKKIASSSGSADDKRKKLAELDERKRQVELKKKEMAAKAAKPAEKPAPAIKTKVETPSHRTLMWEQKLARGAGPSKTPKKIALPEGTGASKVVSLWQQRASGKDETEEEKERNKTEGKTSLSKGTFAQKWLQSAHSTDQPEKVKKTAVDLAPGAGASKFASVWQNRVEGKEEDESDKTVKTWDVNADLPEGAGASKLASKWESKLKGEDESDDEKEVKKTWDVNADLPEGAGASKLASQWETKLKGEDDSAKPVLEQARPKGDPSKLASMWESQVAQNTASGDGPNSKKDIEELKALMAKEREEMMNGGEGGGEVEAVFSKDPEEIELLVKFMNFALEDVADKFTQPLPLPADTSIFDMLTDGVLMCYFFAQTIPDVLDTTAIIPDPQDDNDKIDNWNYCVQSASASGCRLNDIQVENLILGDDDQILTVMWQIVKLGLETDVKLQDEYINNIFPDESPEEIELWAIDKLLLTWVNTVMVKHEQDRAAEIITEDFRDSFFYIILLDEVVGSGTTMLEDEDIEMRAMDVQDQSAQLNRGPVITATGIIEGIYWQNFIFLSNLFLEAASKV